MTIYVVAHILIAIVHFVSAVLGVKGQTVFKTCSTYDLVPGRVRYSTYSDLP